MTNILLNKILVGFFVVSLLSVSFLFISKLASLIHSVFNFKLTIDDFITIIWIAVAIYCFYIIGDFLT